MQEIVIMCIGSDKVSGDSLGPTVGTLLINNINVNAYVYGKLGKTINSKNINEYVYFIKSRHKEATIIAIDACMGKREEIGSIKMSYNGIAAGLAVGRKAERVGDIGIVGVVAEESMDNLNSLMEVPYDEVYSLSLKLAEKVKKYICA